MNTANGDMTAAGSQPYNIRPASVNALKLKYGAIAGLDDQAESLPRLIAFKADLTRVLKAANSEKDINDIDALNQQRLDLIKSHLLLGPGLLPYMDAVPIRESFEALSESARTIDRRRFVRGNISATIVNSGYEPQKDGLAVQPVPAWYVHIRHGFFDALRHRKAPVLSFQFYRADKANIIVPDSIEIANEMKPGAIKDILSTGPKILRHERLMEDELAQGNATKAAEALEASRQAALSIKRGLVMQKLGVK